MATKANKFIGILINNAACRLDGVPTEVIGAIGEVLRDLLHVNLKDVTITVMEEQEIMQSLALISMKNLHQSEEADHLEESIKSVYETLTSRINIECSTPSLKIRIFKECLNVIINSTVASDQELSERKTLRYVLENIRNTSTKDRGKFIAATNLAFVTALLQLAKEYETKRSAR